MIENEQRPRKHSTDQGEREPQLASAEPTEFCRRRQKCRPIMIALQKAENRQLRLPFLGEASKRSQDILVMGRNAARDGARTGHDKTNGHSQVWTTIPKL